MTAMSWAFEAGITVDASCVVSPENIPHLDALIDQLQGFPLNSFTVSRLFPIGHGARPGCSLPPERLTDLHGQLSAKWVGKARFPVRLVGLLGLPRLADCGRGESLVGLTSDGRVTACVLGVETPVVPHPLEVGLLESVRQLRHGLKEKHYRLCCEADS
jgi:MoaA/NifB/PqqE/SkfB family radical SAM enzyme